MAETPQATEVLAAVGLVQMVQILQTETELLVETVLHHPLLELQ
jgi:hypothetical protein